MDMTAEFPIFLRVSLTGMIGRFQPWFRPPFELGILEGGAVQWYQSVSRAEPLTPT